MSAHSHPAPAPIGGPLVNKATLVAGMLVVLMLAILLYRFVFGLGAVTNLTDGYPWGMWIVVDVMIGSAFACGGFSVATLVYIFNRSEYHPLVRPALLASLLGYTLAGAGVIFDLGRWWNVWNMYWPGSANPHSVMFEVAICITAYICVMWIEFSPAFMEKFGWTRARSKLSKVMFFIVALGTLLPMMHQSALGTLMVLMGGQVNPLWQTPIVPMLYLLTAVSMGYAVVLFESCLASSAYVRKIEVHILTPLAKVMLGIVAFYLLARFGDLIARGEIARTFHWGLESMMFWLETACFVVPLFIIGRETQRRNPARLLLAGILLMLGGSLLRLNGYLIGYDKGAGFHYFPSLAEILVTAGMFATELLLYIVITRRFPVLPREEVHV